MEELEVNQGASALLSLPADELGEFLRGRFRPIRLLKQGQGIRTFLASDRDYGDSVVLKLAQCNFLSGEALKRLHHEASILRRLSRSRGVAVRALSYERGALVLAYPYVQGVTLAERIGRRPLKPLEAIRVGHSLLAALQEIHECDIFHGDVKPSNVVVTDTDEITEVTLIDFGLARSQFPTEGELQLQAGTAHYLSPEQAGLIESPVDARSDLYSTGILLYEALAGENPIAGETLNEVLRNHLLHPPPPLRTKGVCVPGALDEIISHLIQRDPADRYQRSEAALADLAQLETHLLRGMADPPLTVGAKDRRAVLTEPSFIGRTAELERLNQWWRNTRAGRGGLVLVEAESGGGKTRLLEEFASRCGRERAWILRGQGIDQAAQTPFQVLAGVGEGILHLSRSQPHDLVSLKERLGDQDEALAVALPQLAPLFGQGAGQTLGPEDFGEIRNLQALSALLDAVGTEQRPALVVLDDCQWADPQTLKLLSHWHRRRGEQGKPSHVLVLAAFRTEEVRMGHPLRRVRPTGQLVVPPFQDPEVVDMARSMAGELPPEALNLISELAGGSPFLAGAVLRGLVEIGALVSQKGSWRFEANQVGALSSSRKAASFLIRRLELLPPSHVELLSVAAILGKEFSLELAAKLAGQDAAEAAVAVEEARKRHILWAGQEEKRCAFVHDKLREALLARMLPQEKVAIHRKAAKHLLETTPEASFELAYHFDAAGDSTNAFPHALKAAEHSRSRHSLEIAEQQYRICARGVQESDSASRRRICEGLGDILLLKGNYAEAEEQIKRLQALCESPFERANIAWKLGEIAFKRGEMAAAAESLERGLRLLGRRVPRSTFFYAAWAAWEGFVQVLHTLFPRIFLARRRRTPAHEPEFLAIRLLSRLAYVYWFGRGNILCAWAHLREMNLAERYGPSLEVAQAYSEHAPVMTMIPYYRRAIAYAKKGLEIRRQLGDLWGEGQSLHFWGVALHAASRFEESIEKCREAVRILERTGDRWEVNTANWHTGFCLQRLGEMDEAIRLLKRVHLEGLEIGDHQASGISLEAWSRASGGAVPGEIIAAEMARQTGDALTRAELWFAESTRLLLSRDEPERATAALEEALAIVRQCHMRQEYVMAYMPWHATCLRRQSEQAHEDLSPKRRQALRKRQKRAVTRALRSGRLYRNSYPHALREAALYWADRGKYRKARRYLAASLRVSEQQGARAESYDTRRARLALGRELDWPTVAEDDTAIRALERSSGFGTSVRTEGQRYLSLADRFETMLESGKKILSSLQRETVVESAREAMVALLRAESCLWLDTKAMQQPPSAASRKLLAEAIDLGKPIALEEDVPRKDKFQTESILIGGIRSALCAPVYRRGKLEGCLYLSHRGVSGLFGEEELRLAQFLGSIIGVALENAAGFEDLRKANESRAQTIAALELTQKELKQNAAQLTRSNEDLENFAFAASHDLKEPLRMVSTYLQLLERHTDGGLDAEGKSYIENALGGARHMFQLIDGLLSYSLVRADGTAVKEVDLKDILQRIEVDYRLTIQDSGASVVYGELPRVWGNETQLNQLFQNLLSNALKFRSHRPLRVEIEVGTRGDRWIFRVSDNGIGFDPRYSQKIFQMFKRLHAKTDYPGSGIGLALCRRVVELHGGEIGAESAPGEGATFWFTLPKGRIPAAPRLD